MSRGYVYVLTKPAMPGVVKIGRTERDVDRRAHELFQTGVPQPFEVAHSCLSLNCAELEKDIHEEMAACRVNASREFFYATPEEAIDTVDALALHQLTELLSYLAPDYSLVRDEMRIDEDAAQQQAAAINYHPLRMPHLYADLTAEELAPAVERFRSKVIALKAAQREREALKAAS